MANDLYKQVLSVGHGAGMDLLLAADASELDDPDLVDFLSERPQMVLPLIRSARVRTPDALVFTMAETIVAAELGERSGVVLPREVLREAADRGLPEALRRRLSEVVRPFIERAAAADRPPYSHAHFALTTLVYDGAGLTDVEAAPAIAAVGVAPGAFRALLEHPQLDLPAWLAFEDMIEVFGDHHVVLDDPALFTDPPTRLQTYRPADLVDVIRDAIELGDAVALRLFRKAAPHLLSRADDDVRARLLAFPLAEIRMQTIAHLRGGHGAEAGRVR